jgi:hypothetical protein
MRWKKKGIGVHQQGHEEEYQEDEEYGGGKRKLIVLLDVQDADEESQKQDMFTIMGITRGQMRWKNGQSMI